MYLSIVKELNTFLNQINVAANFLNPDVFQGAFIKKLSSSNLTLQKKSIPTSKVKPTSNQTHIDIVGNNSMQFFFDDSVFYNNVTTVIDVEILQNNYVFLKKIDEELPVHTPSGIIKKRESFTIPTFNVNKSSYECSAYKKLGHLGEQVQINLTNTEDMFSKMHKLAFMDDALVILKYNSYHYLAIIIPSELAGTLYSLTKTVGRKNVNVPIDNPLYNSITAKKLLSYPIQQKLTPENQSIENLLASLSSSNTAGNDVDRIIKARIGQGQFRKLMLLNYNHQCCLCNITTTEALRASHIKSWSFSSAEERIDIDNGLLLCANHDALFDKNLISFNSDNGQLLISKSLDITEQLALNIDPSMIININTRKKHYMQIHQATFDDKEKNM